MDLLWAVSALHDLCSRFRVVLHNVLSTVAVLEEEVESVVRRHMDDRASAAVSISY